VFACVGWKVTLCDPIRQVTLRSCEMDFHKQLYTPLPFFCCCIFQVFLQTVASCHVLVIAGCYCVIIFWCGSSTDWACNSQCWRTDDLLCCRNCCLLSLSWSLMHKSGMKKFHWLVRAILSRLFCSVS